MKVYDILREKMVEMLKDLVRHNTSVLSFCYAYLRKQCNRESR